MTDDKTMVIIGTGRCGTQAAVTLREEGFAGRIVMLGEESEQPYDRVTLSKHFLYGKPGFHSLYFHDAAFYAERGIELQLGTAVTGIEPQRRAVVLASGRRCRYDKLLLATGLAANRWRGPGSDLRGVHYLRTLAEATRLRAALNEAASRGGAVAVVGSGWIGCEAAAAARELGLSVALIGRDAIPLARQVGPEIGAFFSDAHARHGVDLHLNAELVALEGAGRVERVALADGSRIAADVVLFGIGATPRTELAAAAGLEVAPSEASGGIVVDAYFRTSAAGVFAAGDVANAPNAALGKRARREHYAIAAAQGKAAARAMLGVREPYAQVPFFFSDQYDIWMEATGDPADADDFLVRTLPGDDRFIAFWLRGGRLVAGMNVNIKGVPSTIKSLIKAARPLDRGRLADPAVPLEDLLASG